MSQMIARKDDVVAQNTAAGNQFVQKRIKLTVLC